MFDSFIKGEVTECRVKGRLETVFYGQTLSKKILLEATANVLYAYLPDGSVQIFKVGSLDKLIKEESAPVVYTPSVAT